MIAEEPYSELKITAMAFESSCEAERQEKLGGGFRLIRTAQSFRRLVLFLVRVLCFQEGGGRSDSVCC